MRILVTGATGFVGVGLANHLEREGHSVDVVSRRPNVGCDWNPEDLDRAAARSDAVVHLAGAGILDRRWTEAYKREILQSRVDTTRAIAQACASHGTRLVSTSATGYYGPGDDSVLSEESPPGEDFLARVCQEWEAALEPARSAGAPTAVVRAGVVLGSGGGALRKMLLPFKLGLGGPIGGGRQAFPWVHLDDLCRLYGWLAAHPGQEGAFNGTSPGCCSQAEFARALGRALGRPAFLPMPGFILRLVVGEAAGVLCTGQTALPLRAQGAGFTFRFPELVPALADLVRRPASPSVPQKGI